MSNAGRRYEIRFSPDAEKDLAAVRSEKVRRRIDARIQLLAADPRPHGSQKLSGKDALYRVRCGEYRIVYQIEDQALVVLIVRIRHRRDVYRNL